MTIELARDVEAFLEKQVTQGVCNDPSDLVNDLVRSVRDLQPQPFEITPELEAWLLQAAEGPVSPLTTADFQAIRDRARRRPHSSGS